MKYKKHILIVIKAILLVVLAYISFKQAFPITNSLVVRTYSGGSGLTHFFDALFFALIWGVVYAIIGVAITSISWSILVYFLDRLLLAVEVKQGLEKQEKLHFKKRSFLSYIPIAIGGSLVILFLAIGIFVSYAAYESTTHTRNHTRNFTKRHSVKIYEDKRVSFYMNELESSTRNFVNADVNYSMFKYNVQRKMAVYCLQLAYQDIGGGVRSGEPYHIEENILNNYVTSNNLERQATDNLRYASRKTLVLRGSYDVWKLGIKYPNTCENLMTVDEMYQLRIPSYLKELKEHSRTSPYKKREALELITLIQENFKSTKN